MPVIVVVDEHPLMAAGAEAVLTPAGLEIAAVLVDADAAPAEVAALDPDLVLVHGASVVRSAAVARRLRAAAPAAQLLVMVDDDTAGHALSQLSQIADGFVSTTATAQQIAQAIGVTLAGGVAIAPHLAGELVRAYGRAGLHLALDDTTDRERRALDLLAEGRTDREIALALGVSRRTAQRLLAGLRTRAHARRRTDLVHWAAGRDTAARS